MSAPSKRSRFWLIIAGLLFLAIAAIGIVIRVADEHELSRRTTHNAVPDVVVMQAPAHLASKEIVLPGTIQAWHEAPVYARTNGYIKSWATDIGAQVKTGDVLAVIDTPDVDAQYHQAQADLATAQANSDLAQLTAKRWLGLANTHAVSQQDVDDKVGAAQAAAAATVSAHANLDRLAQLEDFKNVVAPFDGIITARNTDVGALINAGSSAGAELFRIAETDKLRVYVQVPENDVAGVTPDLKATMYLAEYPGRAFPATLDSTADALDPAARTLLVQLKIDNADGALKPGGFCEVHIELPAHGNYVRLPVSTLLFRGDGLHVAVLGADNKAQLKPVTISRDFGNEIEFSTGIEPGDTVILNPPNSLADGEEVRVVTPDQGNGQKDDQGQEDKKDGDDEKEGKSP